LHLINDLLADYGYVAAFLLVFFGAAGLPAPVNLVIAAVGALSARGYFDLASALGVIVTANVLGDLAGYTLARRLTTRTVWARRMEAHGSLARLEGYLKERPLLTVAASRFVPFLNGGVNGLAGMCRLGVARFVAADLIGNAAFAASYLCLGLAFGRAWGDLERLSLIGAAITFSAGSLAIAGILAMRPTPPAEGQMAGPR